METFTTCTSTKLITALEKKHGVVVCDKNMNVKSKTGHTNSIFHKRRERFAFTVKKYEFVNPEITQIYNILQDVVKDCKDKYFHTFEYICEYEINFERKTVEVFHFKITNDFKLFSSQT